MFSGDRTINLDQMIFQQKKLFVKQCIKNQLEINRVFFANIGSIGSAVIRGILIPSLLYQIDIDKVVNLLKGKMTLDKFSDVLFLACNFSVRYIYQ